MKALLRVAAVFAFGCCFLAGLLILNIAVSRGGYSDAPVIAAVGLLFMGIAFFAGGILIVAAERFGPKAGGG
jgi:hypothetical protein